MVTAASLIQSVEKIVNLHNNCERSNSLFLSLLQLHDDISSVSLEPNARLFLVNGIGSPIYRQIVSTLFFIILVKFENPNPNPSMYSQDSSDSITSYSQTQSTQFSPSASPFPSPSTTPDNETIAKLSIILLGILQSHVRSRPNSDEFHSLATSCVLTLVNDPHLAPHFSLESVFFAILSFDEAEMKFGRVVSQVIERSERALMKTSILAMNPAKLLETLWLHPPQN
tara:strand:+ start:110 stop:790 length:681 start_codon:yes stop_codon:yes gene_type:complete